MEEVAVALVGEKGLRLRKSAFGASLFAVLFALFVQALSGACVNCVYRKIGAPTLRRSMFVDF